MIILIFVVGENALNPHPRHFQKRMVDATYNTSIYQSPCELFRPSRRLYHNRQRCGKIKGNLKSFHERASVRFPSSDGLEQHFSGPLFI